MLPAFSQNILTYLCWCALCGGPASASDLSVGHRVVNCVCILRLLELPRYDSGHVFPPAINVRMMDVSDADTPPNASTSLPQKQQPGAHLRDHFHNLSGNRKGNTYGISSSSFLAIAPSTRRNQTEVHDSRLTKYSKIEGLDTYASGS